MNLGEPVGLTRYNLFRDNLYTDRFESGSSVGTVWVTVDGDTRDRLNFGTLIISCGGELSGNKKKTKLNNDFGVNT